MIPVCASPMQELTDTELDAVSGGFLDFLNTVTQTNVAQQVGLAILSIGGVAQALVQSNTSDI